MYMQKKTKMSITSLAPRNRSVRRFIRNIFASILKRQNGGCQHQFQITVLDKLQDIDDSIEMIMREIARQSTRGK
jgi:hypothetical protein